MLDTAEAFVEFAFEIRLLQMIPELLGRDRLLTGRSGMSCGSNKFAFCHIGPFFQCSLR